MRKTIAGCRLAFCAAKHIHDFSDLAPLVVLVAAGDGVLDAMGDVIAENLLLGPAQRRAHGGDLGDDVDAVAVVADHAGEPADLALDAAQALDNRRFCVLSAYLTKYP